MKANRSQLIFIFCFFNLIQSLFGQKNDTIVNKKTILADSIKKSKEVFNFIVTHNAEGYTLQNTRKKTVKLYDKAHIIYNDIDLKAGEILVNYKNNTVYAKGIKDSTKYSQKPIFKQGSQESEQDSILFNFKTKKAIIYGAKTMQGEMLVYGDKSKRINDSTIYMRGLKFTTSKKKIPDYYIATDKAKLVPGKKIIVGGSNMVIADVPTPLYLPFAYYPLTKKRTSGFLLPSYGQNNQQGFFLQNGGYYFVINDYVDLQITSDIYTNGSWAINTGSNYYVRYKYSGNLTFRYQNLINEIIGFSNYSKSSNFNINWRHSQDPKLNPNSRISASVNLSGNSSFYKDSFNEIDARDFITNTFSSSINYYKNFINTPFSLDVSLTQNQNSNTKKINMTLPSFQINMERQYPFQGKGGIKKNALQKTGLNYNAKGEYNIETNDEDFLTSKMFTNAKSGIQHNLSLSTNIKAFKYFTISPSISYKDVWYMEKIRKVYNKQNSEETSSERFINDTISGFSRFNTYNTSASLSTNIYGTFNFKKGKIKSIRHTIRPSISWSFTPDFRDIYNETAYNPDNEEDFISYSPYENGIYSAPTNTLSNSASISVSNVLEAKVKDDEATDGFKKITLLNNLNFSTSYNFAADSLKWSNLRFNAGTSLFKNRVGINLNGDLDPYQVSENGSRINEFNQNLFRLNNLSVTSSFRISNKDFQKDKNDKEDRTTQNRSINNTDDVIRANIGERTNEFVNNLPDKEKSTTKKTNLYKANIPWNISFNYSLRYSNNGYSNAGIGDHTIGFNGNIELTPKWKVGYSSGYDFENGGFSYTRLNFSRDLDSWRFNFNWTPFGQRSSYYFFIGIKSSTLSDLKWDKNKPPDRRLF